jgi:glucokinase
MSTRELRTTDASAARDVIGIDIGGTNVDVALADRTGAVLGRMRLATLAENGPDQALKRIADVVGELSRRSAAAGRAPVVGYAAVCPGVVQANRILMAPNLPGWENLALARQLADSLGISGIEVCNDVRAGALAELRYGALRGVDPGVYVSLGTGIAAALAVGGSVLAGAHQAAGEIAYLIPVGTPRERHSDGEAPLEALIGGKALGERASALLGGQVSAQDLFSRTDPAALRLVEPALDALTAAVANIAVFIDPERVVIGGGMMGSADVILPALAERLRQVVPFAPEVAAARFTVDASLHGAIALALDAVAGSDVRVAPKPGDADSSNPRYSSATQRRVRLDQQATLSREPR